MKYRVWIFGLLSLIGIAAFIQLAFFQTNAGLFFNITTQLDGRRIISPVPGIPLPAGLQNGDQLEFRQMTPAARAALFLTETIKPGFRYDMVVRRDNQVFTVSVASQVPPVNIIPRPLRILGDAVFLAFLILGLLALWRGRNLAAWGLGLMAMNVVIINGLRTVGVSATVAIGLDILGNCVIAPLLLTGLYLMAYAVVRESLERRVKRMFTAVFAGFVVLLQSLSLIRTIGLVYFATPDWPKLILPGISLCLGLISFLILVFGYAHASSEQRLRIRWILASTGIVLLAVAISTGTFLTADRAFQLVLGKLTFVIFLLAVAGYGYAVLRHRLVDVRIVLNRTLVYGVITAIVVGIFAAISALVERATLGRGAGLLLELIVPLALGIVLSTLRKQIDGYINRFLFRRKYAAETALNNFARTCGFIEQPGRLLDLMVEQVYRHSSAQSVAVYERDAGGYTCVRQQGTKTFPERVETDDLAFVGLRAGDHEADLHAMDSVLGQDGYVFSMAVRGKLIGALVCGPRPAEQYSADERELLFHVAQQAGAAWHALRSREHEEFVRSIADGALDAAGAREQARQLITAWQTA